MGNKGSTLAEVLLSLFILSIVFVSFNQFYYQIQRLTLMDKVNQEMIRICKNKMEDFKSGRIYIEEEEYSLSEITEQAISFKEEGYDINIFINPLDDTNLNYSIKISVSKDGGNYQYNLIRLFNFENIELPIIYDELSIESILFNKKININL